MKYYLLYFTVTIFCFASCSSLKHKAYEYDIEVRNKKYPSAPQKFISYKNVLFYFTFNRSDSIIKYSADSAIKYTRFDSLARWIIKKEDNICYKINTFGPAFAIIGKDNLENMMEGGNMSGYIFDKPLHDTIVDGMQYFISDSAAFNNNDSMLIRYFFIKNKRLNTIYSFLNMRHKNPAYRYAGFTMDDYKNNVFFTNLIFRLKEADEQTIKLCEAAYARFQQLTQ